MTTKELHKIGMHVNVGPRDGYGAIADKLVAVVSFDAGAFDEVDERCVKVWRTQDVDDHEDAPADLNKKKISELRAAGIWWWKNHLRQRFMPIMERYGENTYFQPTNEINSPVEDGQVRIVEYLRGMVEAAEEDGAKLCLFGDAAGSPDWDVFTEYWLPFLRELSGRGHIYCCHVYSGLPSYKAGLEMYLTETLSGSILPADSNAARPFAIAQVFEDEGIDVGILIGELGWLRGWDSLPVGYDVDLINYNYLMMKHDHIIGGAAWSLGNKWGHGKDILSGEPLARINDRMAGIDPAFWHKFEFASHEPSPQQPAAPEPEPEPEQPTNNFKLDYISTAFLLPQDAPLLKLIDRPSWADVVQEIDAKRRSVFWSHHDAVAAAVAGLPGSKIVIYGDRQEAIDLAGEFGIAVEIRPIPGEIPAVVVPDVTSNGGGDVDETLADRLSGLRLGQPVKEPWVYTDKFNSKRTYANKLHEGIDLDVITRGNSLAKVVCILEGTVIKTELKTWGYGKNVQVRSYYNDVPITIIYAHLDAVFVRRGDRLKVGDPLGEIGNTGNSTGEHLHLTGQAHGWGLDYYAVEDVFDITPYMPEPFTQPAPPQPEPKKYNIWHAMINGEKAFSRPYEIQHSDGSQSSAQLQYDASNGRHYMVKGTRESAEYEEFWLEDGYVMRGRDTSPGAGRYYQMSENGKYGARWVPAEMAIGESFTRTARVRVYTKSGLLLQDSSVTDTMTLRGFYPKFRLSTGIELFNVFELSWHSGESYFYGETVDGETLGLVAWGRTHQDPNTPQRSEVSEIHEYGARPNSVRETVTEPKGWL